MLNKTNRLHKAADYKKTFRFSRPTVSGRLNLRVSENRVKQAKLVCRFGFIVSNKIDKRASRRNGLKRRLRAIAATLLGVLKPGYDIIVMVRENYTYPYNFAEIEHDLREGLKKVGLL